MQKLRSDDGLMKITMNSKLRKYGEGDPGTFKTFS